MPEANWIETRRPSCGAALVAGPAKDNVGLVTVFVSVPSFASSNGACNKTGDPSRGAAGDLGEGEDVGDGDDA